MHIPRHWAKGYHHTVDTDGQQHTFECWHWSDVSGDDARRQAEARAAMLAQRFLSGQALNRYAYGERPPREEVTQTLTHQNTEVGVVTRNAYGALVLNAPQALFIDIDFPKAKASGLLKFFGRAPDPAADALARVDEWAKRQPFLSLRVYRTFAGLRCLVTSDLFDPAAPNTLAIFNALKADSLYILLCRAQECFRARLTPKPWRCGLANPPARWPWPNAKMEMQYRAWEQTYTQTSTQYAVCQLVKEIGRGEVHPALDPLVRLHDELTGVEGKRPLA